MIGADGLWRNRPSADDILTAIQNKSADIVWYSIMEFRNSPSGKGVDSRFLGNLQLMNKISTLEIELLVFPNDCNFNKLLVITLDKLCFVWSTPINT